MRAQVRLWSPIRVLEIASTKDVLGEPKDFIACDASDLGAEIDLEFRNEERLSIWLSRVTS